MLLRTALGLVLTGPLLAQQATLSVSEPGTFAIHGTVVDAITQAPLAHTRVAIAPASKREALTTLITTEDGRFNFAGLAAGKYTLTAQHRGHLTQSFNQHEQFATSIVVGPELDPGNLVFRLPPEASLAGAITDESGDPVQSAHVVLFALVLAGGTQNVVRRSEAMSDDDGRYHFAHLPAGKYLVAVSAKPWYALEITQHLEQTKTGLRVVSTQMRGGMISIGITSSGPQVQLENNTNTLDVAYPLTFYRDTSDLAQAIPIQLGNGENTIANVTLHPAPALRVRVNVGEPNDPHHDRQQSMVTLQQRLPDGNLIPAQARAQMITPGVFELSGAVPGHYIVDTLSFGGDRTQTSSSQEVTVGNNGEVERNPAQQAVAVTAKVQFGAMAAPQHLGIQLLNRKANQVLTEQINPDGQVEFKPMSPGTYEISISNTVDAFLKSISATGGRVAGRTIDIKGPEPVKLTLVVAQGQGHVTGAAFRNGKPAAGVLVVLVPLDPLHDQVLFRRDQTDSDGSFALNAVPGKYTLLALENGWSLDWSDPKVLKPYMSQGEPVVIEPHGKYELKVKVQ